MSLDGLIRDEGDQWHRRNQERTRSHSDDHLLTEIRRWAKTSAPTRILEVGCAEGWRLAALCEEFGSDGVGVDASPEAIHAGSREFPSLSLTSGVAPMILANFPESDFDLVVLGFFQYYMPTEWLFRLAYEVDRILRPGGHLVIYDFLSNFPRTSVNRHAQELAVHKDQPSAPWTWNPHYELVARATFDHDSLRPVCADPNEWVTIDTLIKLNDEHAYA